MSYSALDIVNDAALFAGVGDMFNALKAEESAMALRLLNDLLDSESTQEYSIYNIIEGTIPLISGTNTYTVGPTLLLNTTPVEITRCTVVDASSITHPMREVGQEEWADIRYKPASGRPFNWFYNLGAPNATLYLYPTPAFINDVLHVWYGAQLQIFANLSAVMVGPIGYAMYLKTSLGELLAAWYKRDLTPAKAKLVQRYRNNVRSVAQPLKVLKTNIPLDRSTGVYNIYTDNQ